MQGYWCRLLSRAQMRRRLLAVDDGDFNRTNVYPLLLRFAGRRMTPWALVSMIFIVIDKATMADKPVPQCDLPDPSPPFDDDEITLLDDDALEVLCLQAFDFAEAMVPRGKTEFLEATRHHVETSLSPALEDGTSLVMAVKRMFRGESENPPPAADEPPKVLN
ncbi:MAG: hypothetical protein PHT12_03940 [Patescibacteria group bacterium]|nr:hypothetical protein [Patescibacteria group bacterium]